MIDDLCNRPERVETTGMFLPGHIRISRSLRPLLAQISVFFLQLFVHSFLHVEPSYQGVRLKIVWSNTVQIGGCFILLDLKSRRRFANTPCPAFYAIHRRSGHAFVCILFLLFLCICRQKGCWKLLRVLLTDSRICFLKLMRSTGNMTRDTCSPDLLIISYRNFRSTYPTA